MSRAVPGEGGGSEGSPRACRQQGEADCIPGPVLPSAAWTHWPVSGTTTPAGPEAYPPRGAGAGGRRASGAFPSTSSGSSRTSRWHQALTVSAGRARLPPPDPMASSYPPEPGPRGLHPLPCPSALLLELHWVRQRRLPWLQLEHGQSPAHLPHTSFLGSSCLPTGAVAPHSRPLLAGPCSL